MIVFLDIDGVLVTLRAQTKPGIVKTFDKEAVEALNKLTDALGAKIVISSSWRHLYTVEELQGILANAGVKAPVIGETPTKRFNDERGAEINTYRRDTVFEGDYLVIDDDIYDIIDFVPEDKILHVEDGWSEAGLTMEMVNDYLERK